MVLLWVQRCFCALLVLVTSLSALAANGEYISGRKWAQLKPQILEAEKGKWVTVPADYLNPHAGYTEIYYSTTPNFDPNKPTVVFIQGGPGGSPHGWYPLFTQVAKAAEINIVIFDARGIAFSRPENPILFGESSFYSSNYVARDLKVIQQHLGIKKWAVWGSSYGTIPATMFGSLFPEATSAVLLEGTVFDAWTSYQQTPFLARILQTQLWKYLDQNGRNTYGVIHSVAFRDLFKSMYALGSTHFREVAKFFNDYKFFPNYETNMNLRRAEEKRLEIKFKEHLFRLKLKNAGVPKITEEIIERARLQDSTKPDSFDFDMEFNFQLVSEEGGTNFQQSKIVFDEKTGFSTLQSVDNQQRRGNYRSSFYPISIPTYYFQGVEDPATEATAAIRHFKVTAKGPKYMFLFPKEGHGPSLNLLRSMNLEWIQNIFKTAVSGQPVTANQIKNFNRTSTQKIAYTEFQGVRVSASSSRLCTDQFKQ